MASDSWGIFVDLEHPRFPEVDIIGSITAPVTNAKMLKIFCVHRFPVEFVGDNGPPFKGHELTSSTAKSRPIGRSQYSYVERSIRTMKKAVQFAHSQGKKWKEERNSFLLDYCTTPPCRYWVCTS